MNAPKIDELMVPLKEYASVSIEASVLDAVEALETIRKQAARRRFKHRAVLVINNEGRIVGKVRPIEIIENLEPNYASMAAVSEPARSSLTRDQLSDLMEKHGLWKKPLDETCRQAAQTPIKDIMHVFVENESVPVDAPLEEALHQMITGRRMSLLVEKEGRVVGVLRLTDIYSEVSLLMKEERRLD